MPTGIRCGWPNLPVRTGSQAATARRDPDRGRLARGLPAEGHLRHRRVDRQAGLVAAGLGATLMPSLAAGAARPDIALVPVPRDGCPVRAIYAATLAGVTSPPALPAFLTFLDQAAAGLRRDTPAGARG